MLETALKRHPECTSPGWEIASYRWRPVEGGKAVDEYLQEHFWNQDAPVIGCRLIHGQMADGIGRSIADRLRQHRPRVLLLRRRDSLRQYVSWILARESGQYHDMSGTNPTTGRVAIDRDDMVRQIGRWRDQYLAAAEFWFDCPCLTVFYEDLVEDWESTMRLVHTFLGVDERPDIQPKTCRQESRELSEIIENYDTCDHLL